MIHWDRDTTVEWLGICTWKFQASAGGNLPPYLPLPSQSAPKQWKQGAFPSCSKSSYSVSQETYATSIYSVLSTDGHHLHFPLDSHRSQLKLFPCPSVDVVLEPFQPLGKTKKVLSKRLRN